MKIVYMGTPDFSVGPLVALIGAGHEVVCVVTRADKPKGRGHELSFSPVKEEAVKRGLPVLQPVRMKDPELWQTLRSYGADVFVVAAYGRILPQEILDIPPYGCINIHASLLPKYRGAAPIQWAIIDGETETGITTMRMDAGLDTGDILKQYRVPIGPEETGGSLFDRLQELGGTAIIDTLSGLEKGGLTPVKQGEPTTAYAKMLTREDGRIDWHEPAARTELRVRGLYPWPGTYTFLNGRLLKVIRAHAAGPQELPEDGGKMRDTEPGTILLSGTESAGKLLVRTGNGCLSLDEVQPEGRKKMEISAYLRGCRISDGDCFDRS